MLEAVEFDGVKMVVFPAGNGDVGRASGLASVSG